MDVSRIKNSYLLLKEPLGTVIQESTGGIGIEKKRGEEL